MTYSRRLLLFAALLSGCADAGDQDTATVHGKVTYRGKPLPLGMVMFTPDNMGPTASGAINTDGTYTLSTYSTGDGAVIGTHKVAVIAKEEQTNFEANAAPTDGKRLIPDKYFLEVTSGLTAEVKPGEENEINFNLED
jgi:hypothetical protein